MITFDVIRCTDNHTYRVTFATDEQAFAYLRPLGATHAWFLTDELAEVSDTMADFLWPSCEHGLSAWLCAGPMHYPADM